MVENIHRDMCKKTFLFQCHWGPTCTDHKANNLIVILLIQCDYSDSMWIYHDCKYNYSCEDVLDIRQKGNDQSFSSSLFLHEL